MLKFRCVCLDHNGSTPPSFEYGFTYHSNYRSVDVHYDLIVSDMAEYFFHNHDGWEAKWPLTFRIWEELSDETEGKLIGDFEVEMEARPHFRTWKK